MSNLELRHGILADSDCLKEYINRQKVAELEKIKAEIDESSFETYEKYSEEPIVCNYTINVMQIIDKRISKLKGENNDTTN